MSIEFRNQKIYRREGDIFKLWGQELLLKYPSSLLINFRDTELDWEIFINAFETIPDNPKNYWTINLYPTTYIKYYNVITSLFKNKFNKSKYIFIELIEMCSYKEANKLHNKNNLPIILDDFGTGFSNFDVLFNLRPVAVKFDQLFLNMPLATIKALVTFIKELSQFVIAEKVETIEHLTLAKKSGFDLFQGYYFNNYKPEEEKYRVEVTQWDILRRDGDHLFCF